MKYRTIKNYEKMKQNCLLTGKDVPDTLNDGEKNGESQNSINHFF